MHRIGRFRPTPALVVASIALLVALTGTSAAALALVPRNSVGSNQVIDGSLKRKDFGAHEVLGLNGVTSRSIAGPVATLAGDDLFPVGSLSIPKPGAYLIWSTARVEGDGIGGQCILTAAGASPDRSISEASPATLWNVVVHGFATPETVELRCAGYLKGPTEVRDIKLTAIRIAG